MKSILVAAGLSAALVGAVAAFPQDALVGLAVLSAATVLTATAAGIARRARRGRALF